MWTGPASAIRHRQHTEFSMDLGFSVGLLGRSSSYKVLFMAHHTRITPSTSTLNAHIYYILYICVSILVIRLVSCRFTALLKAVECQKKRRFHIVCAYQFRISFLHIRFIFIIIAMTIFLRPNAQTLIPWIIIWCWCERARYTRCLEKRSLFDCIKPMQIIELELLWIKR